MSLILITAPAAYPVSIAEVKSRLRLDTTDEDATIDRLIAAATSHLDGANGILGCCLVQQTWELRQYEFGDRIEVPLPPYVSITSVKYLDTSGVEQTLATTVYDVIDLGFPGAIIQPKYDQAWPSIRYQSDAVRVRFVAGYASVVNGGLVGTIPGGVIEWMLSWIGTRFENRENVTIGTIISTELGKESDDLLAPVIRNWF